MRDDVSPPNLGQCDRLFDAEFFWRTYRVIEQQWTRVLSKGPLQVSQLNADTIDSDTMTLGGQPVATKAYADTKVAKSGDTMTGPLNLVGMPSAPQQAAMKQYVDNGDTAANNNANTRVLKAGDTMTGSLLPSPTGGPNLGSATNRWGTVYTSDLSLSNGIGDWTIVEGEDDLFITNNRTGKKYKFVLAEVDSANAN